jgi:hypothetical protein
VTLFPNILQSAAALKAYAPIDVKFWESQKIALQGLKDFAEGWFALRHKTAQAALEAAKHLATPLRLRCTPGISELAHCSD